MAKQRQRFVGDIQRQLGLPRGAGLFFALNALHQQHNKADTDATEDHWNADFRDDIDPQRGSWCPDNYQNHGQRLTQHAAENTDAPALCFGDFQVDPARYTTRQNAGDKAGDRRHAADIN